MAAELRNVGDELASAVAEDLGLPELPAAISPAREPVHDLPTFPALSILANGPDSFADRKSPDEHSAADFISRCARLRFWPRQASTAQRAGTAEASADQG